MYPVGRRERPAPLGAVEGWTLADDPVGLVELVRVWLLDRTAGAGTSTVGADFAAEQSLLRPLPGEVFETGLTLSPRVDRHARVNVRQTYYSVPARFIGARVRVLLRAGEVMAPPPEYDRTDARSRLGVRRLLRPQHLRRPVGEHQRHRGGRCVRRSLRLGRVGGGLLCSLQAPVHRDAVPVQPGPLECPPPRWWQRPSKHPRRLVMADHGDVATSPSLCQACLFGCQP